MRLLTRVAKWPGAIIGYAFALVLFTLAYSDREPYDDAHFVQRIAQNLLDHGSLAWNRGEAPVHGVTSQALQGLAVLVALVTREHAMLAMRALSLGVLVSAFVVLHRLTSRRDGAAALVFGFCSAVLLFPVLSGMETALAVLSLSVLLWLLYSERADSQPWALAPATLVLIYLVRPDAALLGFGPVVAERWRRSGRLPLRELALIAGLLVVVLAVLRLYYGSALPLPFYAKQAALTPYDAAFVELSERVGRQRFALFAACAAPLFFLGGLRRDATNLILLGSALTFVAYHLLATVDVMGMHGRFYAPAMPLLILAAARAGEPANAPYGLRPAVLAAAGFLAIFAVLTFSHSFPSGRLETAPKFLRVLAGAGGTALLLSRGQARAQLGVVIGVLAIGVVGSLSLIRKDRLRLRSDDEFLALQTARTSVYRGLDTLRACFGERADVYHSEVGLPGLRFPEGKVGDLAGLFRPDWLFETRSFERSCSEERPYAIFLPHRNYVAKNRELLSSRCLRRYTRVVGDSSSPLYVRRELVKRFRKCAAEKGDSFVSKPQASRRSSW